MSQAFNVGKVGEFYSGVLRPVEIEGYSVAVVRLGDQFFAFSNYCPHMGAELTGSMIDGKEIICWWHGSTFDLETGEVTMGPGTDPLRMYEVRIEDGNVIVVKG